MSLGKIVTALLVSTGSLIVPFIASQFVEGWLWTGSDYVFAWVLLSFLSLGITLALNSSKSTLYKGALALTVGSLFLLVWINGAVQIIGDGEGPNGLYLGVVIIGLVGAIFAQLRSQGMSYVLFAMAIAQLSIPLIAYFFWPPSAFAWTPSVPGVLLLNSFWVGTFAAASYLFRQSDMAVTK